MLVAQLRRNRSEQGLEPIYICTEQQFRIMGKIVVAVRAPEGDYDIIALLQDDGACTVVREVGFIPVLRSHPEILWGQHVPATRDRSPAERGSCRLTQHFDFKERDVEATEQAHEPLRIEVVLYCVSAVLRPPFLNSVYRKQRTWQRRSRRANDVRGAAPMEKDYLTLKRALASR
jgi:hypothetical protein